MKSTKKSKAPAFNAAQVRQKLIAHMSDATPEQEKDGRDWYKHALLAATNMAIQHGVSVDAAAGVIATLSPQHTWAQNLKLAEECLSGGTPRCFRRAAMAATSIRDTDTTAGSVSLRGPKVKAFYRCIMGYPDVVLDRWMMRAMGVEHVSLTPKRYDELREIVFTVARQCRVRPDVLQATVWCVVRGKSF